MNRLKRWISTRNINSSKYSKVDDNTDKDIDKDTDKDIDNIARRYNRSKSYPEIQLNGSQSMISQHIQNTSYKNRCQICKRLPASFIRKFDYSELPVEYFYPPEENFEVVVSRLQKEETDRLFYPDCWIHLPKEKILTRYDTRYCISCKNKEKELDQWNYWTQFEKV
jgi:hypothetical protein